MEAAERSPSSPSRSVLGESTPTVSPAADFWRPLTVDRNLLRKYDRPGPRYTSYPTAPQLREGFGAVEQRRLLERSAASGRPLSLYVHVPFCRAQCLYCGCSMQVASSAARGTSYLDAVGREIAALAALAGGAARQVVQLHLGGGTPTFLLPADLRALLGMLRRNFALAADAELAVEVDPRACSPAHLDVLAEAGVNRLSLGIQDLDPEVQRAVHRVQPAEMVWAVLDGARARGITAINLDLMYGLPRQTPERFAATLREVLRMRPQRFAAFSFAYLPQAIRHQRALDAEALPSSDAKLALLELTIDELTAAGYLLIGMDHFALPSDPLALALRAGTLTRNFQGYSAAAETDVIAVGASAITQTADGLAQNRKAPRDYEAAVAREGVAVYRGLETTAEDRLRREVVMSLMCHFRVDLAAVGARHGVDGAAHFAPEVAALAPFADDGLVELDGARLEVSSSGRLLVRNLAMVFDTYLRDGGGHAYSRTV